MEFSTEQYEQIIKAIEDKRAAISTQFDGLPGVENSAIDHWWVTDAMADSIRFVCRKIGDFCTWALKTLAHLLEGALAPVLMFGKSSDWNSVRKDASLIQADLTPDLSKALREWQGSAAVAYKSTETTQNAAIGRISDIADKTASALTTVAVAGLVFYAALLAIATKAAAVISGCIAAIESVMFSWAGALISGEETAIDTAAIWTMMTALTTAIGAQIKEFQTMQSGETNFNTFPYGKWPDPEAETFNDSSRLGGTAPWSVK